MLGSAAVKLITRHICTISINGRGAINIGFERKPLSRGLSCLFSSQPDTLSGALLGLLSTGSRARSSVHRLFMARSHYVTPPLCTAHTRC